MKEKKLLYIIFFNILIILSEVIFGLISNSFALIVDALHNAGDVIALVITYLALKFATIKSSFKYTFGFVKAEMMATFVNSVFLIITMFYVIYASIYRLFEPEIIEPLYMIGVGFIALMANGLSTLMLHKIGLEHSHEDSNIKSAYLHMLGDTLLSVGVVVAGIFIYYFQIYSVDSLLSIFFSLYILYHTYPLFYKSFLSLIDVNIVDISENSLNSLILIDEKILEYNDLHVYKPSSKFTFISFHIVLENENISLFECETITNKIKKGLKEEGFNHILIEVDTHRELTNQTNCHLL